MKKNLTQREILRDSYEDFACLLMFFECADYYKEKKDEETILRYITTLDPESIADCLKEGREVLELNPFPWEWVCSSANGFGYTSGEENSYSDEELCKKWVTSVLNILEEEAKKAGKL